MPTEGFTTGLDVSIDLYDASDRSIASIPGITSFSAKARTNKLESRTLDGENNFGTTHQGYEITIAYDRQDGRIDAYFAEKERRYREKLPSQTVTITQTIREPDGSLSQYRFEKVTLDQDDAGTYTRDEKVTGSITGMAGKRVDVLRRGQVV